MSKFLLGHCILIFSFFFTSVLWANDQNNSFSDEELRKMLFGDNSSDSLNENKTRKAHWISSYSGETGAGYSDNPLYGPFIHQEAAYVESSLEAFFLREGDSEYFTYLYLFGEGKAFDALPEHKTSTIILGQFEHAYTPDGSAQSYGFRLRQVYYDQGFDFSELGLPNSMNVRSNKSEFIPYLSKKFSEQLKITIQLAKGLEDFKVITDDNSDTGISLSLDGSTDYLDWKLESEFTEKKYKERPKRNGDGSLLSTESLLTKRMGLSLKLKKDFELPLFNSSNAKIQWTALKDNAGGYYDFKKIAFSLEQEFEFSKYKIDLNIGATETVYDERMISTGSKFERQSMLLGTTCTRAVNEQIDAYFKWSREEDFSNVRDYEYHANFWSIGIAWDL